MIGNSTVNTSAEDRFQHLSPITSEFFHLGMKFLGIVYKRLFKEGSGRETGTLKAEQSRTSRLNVKADAKKAYTPCKEFLDLYVDCHIIEAICHHFNMDDRSQPLVNLPSDPEDACQWAKAELRAMVMSTVGTFVYRKCKFIIRFQWYK